MRAFLSSGAGHAEDGSRYVCGLNVDSALAEARAILAETEPDACGDHQRLTWLGDWSGDVAALLSAFVGEGH